MSELVTTIREALAELAGGDRGLRRFGAAAHRYELAPPLDEDAVLAIERELGAPLPVEYRDFIREIGAGGAGPAYGLFPAEAAARAVIRQQRGPWHLALPLAHFGCGYVVVLALDGLARGQVWLDARAIDFVATIRPTFTTWYVDWIDRLAQNALPDGFVPAGACALPAALSGYFAVWERRLGLAAGTLANNALRDALAQLGPGAIEVAADSALPLFEPGDRVDPCIVCAGLVTSFAEHGLDQRVIAPGVPPVMLR